MAESDENNDSLVQNSSTSLLERKVSAMSDMLQTMSTSMCNLNTQLQGKIDSLERQVFAINNREQTRQNDNDDNVAVDDDDDEISFHPRHGSNYINSQNSNMRRDRNTNQNIGDIAGGNNLKMKPQTYDGLSDISEYLTQFNIVAEINGWSYQIKALYLASSLTGSARSLLSELSEVQKRDFNSLVEILRTRYGTKNKAEIFRSQLKSLTRQKGQSITDLVQQIRKLTRQAYPDANTDLKEILALDTFIDSIDDSDIRLRLRECCPKSIAEAETIAVRLETHKLVDSKRLHSVNAYTHENRSNSNKTCMETVLDKIETLSEKVGRLENIKSSSEQTHNTNTQTSNYKQNTNYRNGFNNQRGQTFRNQYNNNRFNNNRPRYNDNRNQSRNASIQNFNRQSNVQNNQHLNGQRSSWRTTTRPNQN